MGVTVSFGLGTTATTTTTTISSISQTTITTSAGTASGSGTTTSGSLSSPQSSLSHSSIPTWNGKGDILQGYCATPGYTLLEQRATEAVWAPVAGCLFDKPDCCPYVVDTATAMVVVGQTITVNIDPSTTQTLSTSSKYNAVGGFPAAAEGNQAVLARCPGDYFSVSGGCCPKGYNLNQQAIGGQIPCFSSLANPITPPVLPSTELASYAAVRNTPTSAITVSSIVNIVYAIHYPVASPSPGLSTGAKAGIGIGTTIATFSIGILAFMLIWQRRKHKRELQQERDSSGARTTTINKWVDNSGAPAELQTDMAHNSNQSASSNPSHSGNGLMGTSLYNPNAQIHTSYPPRVSPEGLYSESGYGQYGSPALPNELHQTPRPQASEMHQSPHPPPQELYQSPQHVPQELHNPQHVYYPPPS